MLQRRNIPPFRSETRRAPTAEPGQREVRRQAIRIRPTAGLDRLKEVAVLLYHPPQRTESDQALPNVEKKVRSKQ